MQRRKEVGGKMEKKRRQSRRREAEGRREKKGVQGSAGRGGKSRGMEGRRG